MGKSQSIEEKEKQDEAFRAYMKKVDEESRAEEAQLRARIEERVRTHYEGNGWEHYRLFGDSRGDYQNYDSWSLDRITAIIAAIGKALAAADYPSKAVPGSNQADPKAIETAKAFAGAFAGDLSLIIARVTSLMTAFMSQFSVATETSQKQVLQDLPMAGGLHLFFANSGKVFKKTEFFSNQFIGAFQVVFEAHVSAAEAKAIGLQQILRTTEYEMERLNALILEIRDLQIESLRKILKEDPKLYLPTKKTYDDILEDTKRSREELVKEYDKYVKVTRMVDSFLPDLDLSELGRPSLTHTPVRLDDVFSPWEAQVARRYLAERLAA